MKRFLLLKSIVAAVVWLLPVVGPFAASVRASVVTIGNVEPGGTGVQPDPWVIGDNFGRLEVGVGDSGTGTLNIEAGGVVSNGYSFIGYESGSTGVVTVTGANSQWNNSDNLHVGNTGDGTLKVTDGGVVSNTNGYIGFKSGSMGVAVVTGSGSQWNNSESLRVGRLGEGTLNIIDKGVVSSTVGYVGRGSGSTGVATVTGSGSQWNNSDNLYVGRDGSGTLNVEAGGLVSNSVGYIGYGTSSTGEALVTGSGSQWNNSGYLVLGDSGSGTLNVEAGGVVSNLWGGYIGSSSGSTGIATVTGAGSQWNNSQNLYVARYGDGTLNVEVGGVVSNDHGYIGRGSGSTGVATVTGSGSQWNNAGKLYVAHSGSGTLNVEAGGVVSNTYGYIGSSSGSTGVATVTGSGSQWNNSNSLYIGGSPDPGADGSGTLNLYDSGLVTATDTTKLYSTGTINLDGGTLDVGVLDLGLGTFNMTNGRLRADRVVGDINVQGGVLAPGDGPGTMTFEGDVVLGLLSATEIELGGTVRGDEYEAMIVDGNFTLNGSLNVLPIGGFAPRAGDRFDILDFEPANLSGLFGTVNLPALASGLDWDQSNLYTTGELLVLPPISADFNDDGDVDGDDFLLWQIGFPTSTGASHMFGDADYDGDVDGEDFLVWQNNFPSPTAISSVPEPNSLALLALGGLLMLKRRRT